MLDMTIDWKKSEAVFRLLAAVHGALGEDASRKSEMEYDLSLVESKDADSQKLWTDNNCGVRIHITRFISWSSPTVERRISTDKTKFKGRFGQIAELYGPEASYDAIKSEWKKVARLGDDLWRRHQGQQLRARGTQSTVSRKRQRRPRETIKPETHDVIDLDSNETVRASSRAQVRADEPPGFSKSTRKHEVEIGHDAPELEPDGRVQNKRARLDSALFVNEAINRDTGSQGEVANYTFSTYTDDFYEQIRRAISTTPVKQPNLNPQVAASSPDPVIVPSTIKSMAVMEANRAAPDQDLHSGWRRQDVCQVSTAEHDRLGWESPSHQMQRLQPQPETDEIYPRPMETSPEAGPSRIRSGRCAEVYQDESKVVDVIYVSDSEEDRGLIYNAEDDVHEAAKNNPDKGKARMVELPPKSSDHVQVYPVPSRVSYINTELGICYLCSVEFSTIRELRIHERGKWHSRMLADDRSVEKAQARLERYGLFQNFCFKTENFFVDVSAGEPSESTQRHARTIIRGPDRAVQEDENGFHVSSLKDVVEHADSGRCRVKKPLAPVTSNTKGCTNEQGSKAKIEIHDPQQMARILQVNKFSRSGTVHRILSILEHVPSTAHKTAPQCFNQFSSQPLELLPSSSETRHPFKVWIIDAEFANLKGQGNRYDLSVNITNLVSGQTIVNHRLKLPVSVDELEKKIWASGSYQARKQFIIHYRQPCDMPVVTPRELARLLKGGGFGPRDFVFSWASSNVDFDVVNDFLAREDLQHNLMPPEGKVVKVLFAWRELLPGVRCALNKLFSLVFPNSPLRYVHHIADLDTKKLGLMTWKLRDLDYTANGQQTGLDLCI